MGIRCIRAWKSIFDITTKSGYIRRLTKEHRLKYCLESRRKLNRPMPSRSVARPRQGQPGGLRAERSEGMAREGSQSPHVAEQGDTDSHLKFGGPWSKNGVRRIST